MKTTLGIIEGFYGRLYNDDERKSLCRFAQKNGYSYYIYAPKNDKSLRREWKKDFSKSELNYLKEFSRFCKKNNMDFGIGISPLGITENLVENVPILLRKIDLSINTFSPKIIGILFDDIKLYTQDEGQRQKEVINSVYNHIRNKGIRLIFCPTYYSFDPILEKVFGPCPSNYFDEVIDGLDAEIEIFWTGNKVLSKSITGDDIEKVNNLFKRKVTLWDNYPVNDGKLISKKIYTREFSSRENLDGIVKSHAVNPMLEANLTKIAVSTLPLCYQNETPKKIEQKRFEIINKLFKNQKDILIDYLNRLNDCGIDDLTIEEKLFLHQLCKKTDTKASREICAFLDGVYRFDPACLTS